MAGRAFEIVLIALCVVIIILGTIGYISTKIKNAKKGDSKDLPKSGNDTAAGKNNLKK